MPTDPTNDSTTETEEAAPAGASNVFKIQPKTVPDCNYCKLYGDSVMMPPHFASAGCQSGGRNHCTCGICF
jgi:predicted metal-binding protein